MMHNAYTKTKKPDHDHSYDCDRILRHDQPHQPDKAVLEFVLNRSAAKYFDRAATFSDDQIRPLVRIGTSVPTSFYMQNRRCIAVGMSGAKARPSPIAWNRPPIVEAALTFIGCGRLTGHGFRTTGLRPQLDASALQVTEVLCPKSTG